MPKHLAAYFVLQHKIGEFRESKKTNTVIELPSPLSVNLVLSYGTL